MSSFRSSLEIHLPVLTIFDAQATSPESAAKKGSENFVGSDPIAGFKRLIADAKSHMDQRHFEDDAEVLSSLVARQGGLGELATKFANMVG